MSKSESTDKKAQNGPIHYPLWFGGSASCFAACVTHPLDLCEWTACDNLDKEEADWEQ